MNFIVARMDAWSLAIALAVAMLVAWRIGTMMGVWLRHKADGREPSKFDDASMALLGLLLAFTFGVSISKHDQRRLAVVAESNAIGDFYTCASLLKKPHRARLQEVIREYAQEQMDTLGRRLTEAEEKAATGRALEQFNRMTEIVNDAITEGTPIAVSLTNTLNEV